MGRHDGKPCACTDGESSFRRRTGNSKKGPGAFSRVDRWLTCLDTEISLDAISTVPHCLGKP